MHRPSIDEQTIESLLRSRLDPADAPLGLSRWPASCGPPQRDGSGELADQDRMVAAMRRAVQSSPIATDIHRRGSP